MAVIDLGEKDDFNPKKIADELFKRCMAAKAWYIRCIVDESWTGISPFRIIIEDGIFHCMVIAPSLKEAYEQVSNKLPVVKFLDYKSDRRDE